MTTVYLDARFALDLAVNYCLLACAARLDGGAVRRRRLALAAGLGAGYGVLTLLPGLGALGHPVGAALAAAGMLLAAYGPSDRLLRRGALFLVLSCAFGGVLVLVSLARGGSAGAGGLLGPSLGMRGILIAAALSYGALSLALGRQFSKTQAEGGLCPLTLTKGEKTLRLLALIDTGNTLRDPLTGEGWSCWTAAGPVPWSRNWPVFRPRRFSARWSCWPALPGRSRTCACCPTRRWGCPAACCWRCGWTRPLGAGSAGPGACAPSPRPRFQTAGATTPWWAENIHRRLAMNWKEHLLRTLARLGLWRPGNLHYIGGSDVLPAPLSREEERACIARLAEGDQEASATLIEHNLRLVVYIARRFENTGINIEDLISIGTIGLIKAVGTYQPAKNIKLATYASRCIENEILMHLRKTASQKTEIPLDEPLSTDGNGNELLLSDILGTDSDLVTQPMEADADRQMLADALETLTGREREIITLRFGLGGRREHTQKEVADHMGISQSYISRLEKRIIRRLRREILRVSQVP